MTDKEKTAYIVGMAVAIGFKLGLHKQGLSFDEIPKDRVIFRWSRKAKKRIAIDPETGEVSGVCEHLTPNKATGPSLEGFIGNNPKLKNLKFSRQARLYLYKYYKDKKIENPKGLKGCKVLIFTGAGLKETANGLNPDKAKILPYLEYIYKTGKEVGYCGNYHDSSKNINFHYTQKIIKISDEILRVTLVAKQVGSAAYFSHYFVDKADPNK